MVNTLSLDSGTHCAHDTEGEGAPARGSGGRAH